LEFINVWAFPERRVSSVPDGHADNFFLTKMKINGSMPIRFENKCAKVKKKATFHYNFEKRANNYGRIMLSTIHRIVIHEISLDF
jgi:hypothetical protein